MKKQNKKIQLPAPVKFAWGADVSGDVNEQIADAFELSTGQLARMTRLTSDVFFKRVKLEDLATELEKRLEVDAKKALEIQKELLIKRFAIADDDWFDGQVMKIAKELEVDFTKYQDFFEEYKTNLKAEYDQEFAQEDAAPDEDELKKKKMQEVPDIMADPEAEKKSIKKVFGSLVVDILKVNNYELKVELNSRLILLLLRDETEKKFQKQLLEALYNNEEKLTEEDVVLKKEKHEPTVGNWLKDYINYVGVEQVISTIKKAQYFTTTPNVKKLNPKEKEMLDRLLDLYISLKNFYANIIKVGFDEVELFPLSGKEKKEYRDSIQESEEEKKEIREKSKPVDIKEVYEGPAEDRQVVLKMKKDISDQTRREYNKVAYIFEEYLLGRKKHGIVACLELFAETGTFDNLFGKDERFQKLLIAYFNRHGQTDEIEELEKNPYQQKFVLAFVKYIFTERLGLPENEAARYAAKLSNIFRTKGPKKYSGLAYLDLEDNKFKWAQ